MKHLSKTIVFLLTLLTFASIAEARRFSMYCSSYYNRDHEMILTINNGDVEYVRLYSKGNGGRPLSAYPLDDQDHRGHTQYEVGRFRDILTVENQVLNGRSGEADFRYEYLWCSR